MVVIPSQLELIYSVLAISKESANIAVLHTRTQASVQGITHIGRSWNQMENTERQLYMNREKEVIDSVGSAHRTLGDSKSKIYGSSQQEGNRGRISWKLRQSCYFSRKAWVCYAKLQLNR